MVTLQGLNTEGKGLNCHAAGAEHREGKGLNSHAAGAEHAHNEGKG
jgi:hypothetical protein